jgi:hypothetical protein
MAFLPETSSLLIQLNHFKTTGQHRIYSHNQHPAPSSSRVPQVLLPLAARIPNNSNSNRNPSNLIHSYPFPPINNNSSHPQLRIRVYPIFRVPRLA